MGGAKELEENMPSKTPFFKAFGPLLFGRPAKRAFAKLGRMDALQELYEIFGHLVPDRLLAPSDKGVNSRERIFSPQVTFWAFAAQILSPGTACREIVRRVEAWWRERFDADQTPSASTSAYCQARARLDPAVLEIVRAEIAWGLEKNVLKEERWLGGRSVKIVDGTGISMPDTEENQAQWPQPSGQEVGLGFPSMKLVGLFSLSSGALLESANGNKHVHESTLFRSLWSKLQKGDIVLADRGFCSYAAMAGLLQHRGVDSVMRLHQMRKADFRTGRRLGPDERLIVWNKPQRTEAWSEEEFAALPATLTLRLIRLRVGTPGFRTKSVLLVTTLVDPIACPADEIRELYGQRWQVELHFQQIKTYLGMDVLRCKSPELIEREALMHQVAYNLVRSLMQRSAHLHQVSLTRLSFKGTLDTLRHWSVIIAAAEKNPRKQAKLIDDMLALISEDPVPERPGRSEPRAKKRRAKNYQLLTKPRRKAGNLPRRNRPRSKKPNSSLS
jgi:hypothetical protein